MTIKRCFLAIVATLLFVATHAQDFCIRRQQYVNVYVPYMEQPVVDSAFELLRGDVKAVLDCTLQRVPSARKANVVCKVDASLPREGFRLQATKGRLHISGADAHGLAYGLLEVSRLIGVSPWEWWADCTPNRLSEYVLKEGYVTQQSPAVKFRGIFINDEDWGMMPWATKREREDLSAVSNGNTTKAPKGVIGPVTNERIFQLLLRLRGNCFWPAMHECTRPFFTVDGNREVAAKYGIYMGGSHCEPMACTPATEWAMRGKGDYNYVTNSENVRAFWQERLDEVKGQEVLYTIGMRGVHDGSMQGVKTDEEKLTWLQKVIDDQREMLAATLKQPAQTIPQVFVPYKEVLQIYQNGLRVPDDVTLMWTDDNYGYIRHFPDSAEAQRSGGNGIYYHASYWGRPHDYLWLATFSPYLMRQQMSEAYRHGVRDTWILNVGDLKPAEYQIELWMDMAWKGIEGYGPTGEDPMLDDAHMQGFYRREFGEALASRIVPLMQEAYRLAYIRKPEFMAGTRTEEADRKYWSTVHPIDGWTQEDVAQRVAAYKSLSDQVEVLWNEVPRNRLDAFFQLVKYPVQAAAQMNFKFLSPEWSAAAYDSIQVLTKQYNQGFGNGGKWDGIMSSAPRGLPVFNRVDSLPTYPHADSMRRKIDLAAHLPAYFPKSKLNLANLLPTPDGVTPIRGLGYDGTAWAIEQGASVSIPLPVSERKDSIELEVHLLPALPVVGSAITFEVAIGDGTPVAVDYQTYDRSEEWKQNVLRNQAVRRVRLSIPHNETAATLTFKARTEGVVLDQLYIRE